MKTKDGFQCWGVACESGAGDRRHPPEPEGHATYTLDLMDLSPLTKRKPPGNRVRTLWFGLVAVAALLPGCGREEVKVYRVVGDSSAAAPETPPSPASLPGAATTPSVTGKTPEGWETAPLGTMRIASFRVRGANGEQAEVSVVPLGGLGGDDLENVNRWRGQIGLPSISSDELSKVGQQVVIGESPSELYDLAGQAPASTHKTRILATVLRRDGVAWFFKMDGDDALVSQQKPAFIAFLGSIQFHPAAETAAAPVPPGTPAVPDGAPVVTAGNAAVPGTVPPGWKAEPATQMLLARFLATDGPAQAEITVSAFPGDVGGLLANVNRWRNQLQLPPLAAGDLSRSVTEIQAQGSAATLVDFAGTNGKTGEKARLVGVILPKGGQTWFYKLMGAEPVVAREKPALLAFVDSAR